MKKIISFYDYFFISFKHSQILHLLPKNKASHSQEKKMNQTSTNLSYIAPKKSMTIRRSEGDLFGDSSRGSSVRKAMANGADPNAREKEVFPRGLGWLVDIWGHGWVGWWWLVVGSGWVGDGWGEDAEDRMVV